MTVVTGGSHPTFFDETVDLTQATTGQVVTVFKHQVYAVTYMPTMKATVVLSTGGGAIPVNETREQVLAAMVAASTTKR